MSRRERGQTLPDFAVGIAIFLITVSAVFLFVPQLTLPYEGQERPVVVQRVASDLSADLLAAETPPSALNETCTLAFFNGTGGDSCPFDAGAPVTEQVGVESTYSVNVTLRDAPSDDRDSERLCEVGGSIDDCDDGGTPLSVGPPLPEDGRSVALARERVFVNDTEAVLEVGVW